MIQYRLFKWDDDGNLIFLGNKNTDAYWDPFDKITFEDVDGQLKDWVICEILLSDPGRVRKPNGTVYVPNPLCILCLA